METNNFLDNIDNDGYKSQSPVDKNDIDYFELLPVPVIFVDNSLLIIRINRHAAGLFSTSIMNTSLPAIFKLHNSTEKEITLTLFQAGDFSNREVTYETEDRIITLLMSFAPIKNENENVSGYIITLTDVTSQVNELNSITQELKEKSLLLKEIHHRIKNNLQIINSIITLQIYYAKNEELNELLIGLQTRIKTIALIHEKLYQTDHPSELNVCYFMKDLQKILVQVYEVNPEFIRFNCDVEEILLETDIVLQLGLIVNELMTNSVKYAFPSGKGNIYFSFKLIGDKYELLFKDDGIGIPDDILLNKTETLGSQLLETLIEQLNGKSVIKSNHGTEYIITFPIV